jgi:hypothetical protein
MKPDAAAYWHIFPAGTHIFPAFASITERRSIGCLHVD